MKNRQKLFDDFKEIIRRYAESDNLPIQNPTDRNIAFFKSCLLPADIINREVAKRNGDSKTFEIYNRIAHKKGSLVAYIKHKAKDYSLVLVRGTKKYFIFVKYESKVFAKMFGIKNTIGMWELNKENYEWLKKNSKLKIQNQAEWERFEAMMIAQSLSEGVV